MDAFVVDHDSSSQAVLSDELIAQYERDGFIVVHNAVTAAIGVRLAETAEHFAALQARKLTEESFSNSADDPLARLDQILLYFERTDPAIIKSIQELTSMATVSSELTSILPSIGFDRLLGTSKMVSEGRGTILPSIPGSKRRITTWHSEAHWLPLRKRFLNCWLPLFRPKRPGLGTMHVLKGSHHRSWDFFEYQWDDGYIQYEIPDAEQHGFEIVRIEADPGDLVIFDRNMVHRSEPNDGKDISYVWINRYFDVSQDLTLSANPGVRPYSPEALKTGRQLIRF